MASAQQATADTTQVSSLPPPSFYTPSYPSPDVEQISCFPRVHVGFDKQANTTTDPFAAQREGGANPFKNGGTAANTEAVGSNGAEPEDTETQGDEWDASKTLPSKFQQRKGSVFATPSSRDGHVGKNADRDAKYHEKLAERGWGKKDKDRRGSKSSN